MIVGFDNDDIGIFLRQYEFAMADLGADFQSRVRWSRRRRRRCVRASPKRDG